jgi:D-alanyl-D-alanine carboxypeptidase (penicillin-binding protein 5/6)
LAARGLEHADRAGRAGDGADAGLGHGREFIACGEREGLRAIRAGHAQDRFAAQMTLKARELGMTQTRYVNPNGLPDARQLTSARDLAILARAVMRDYPQYYSYFGQNDWVYNGREYRNTNGLLRAGSGYDGMKTGFTNASGYNLAASAVRDGRRLITIVLGGRSTASRNAHVAALMDTGFEVERARARGETVQVAQTFFEARGFGIGGENTSPIEYAAAGDNEDGEAGVGSSALPAGAVAYTALPASPPPAVRVTPSPSERPADVTAILNGGTSVATPPRPRPPAAREPARAPSGRWSVQVGAFRDEQVARDWLTEINRRFRSQFTAAERTVQNAEGWYRSRFTGMTEQGARSACAALSERRVTCMVVRPD